MGVTREHHSGIDRRQLLRGVSVGAAALAVPILFAQPAFADGPGPLAGRLFGGANKTLFVSLHGDLSRGGQATYHFGIASRVVASASSVTGFALIRPGYSGGSGLKSPGSNNGRRDHYTSKNNALVAQTIKNLKATIGAKRVVALGHSGGAAQLGVIIGRYPGLIDSAVLVSLPAYISRWRKMNSRSAWTKSQSPHSFANKVPASTRVLAFTGGSDSNTSPTLASDYIAKLRARGVPASFTKVRGAKHNYKGALQKAAEKAAKSEVRR